MTRVLNNSQWEEYIVREHRAELITEDQPSMDNIIATGEDSYRSGRIDATDADTTRNKTNAANMRRGRLNQASQHAKANRINWGEIE